MALGVLPASTSTRYVRDPPLTDKVMLRRLTVSDIVRPTNSPGGRVLPSRSTDLTSQVPWSWGGLSGPDSDFGGPASQGTTHTARATRANRIAHLCVTTKRRRDDDNRPRVEIQPDQVVRVPLYAASILAMSIFFIVIIASNARLAAARSGSVNALVRAMGVICQDNPHLSLHQPH